MVRRLAALWLIAPIWLAAGAPACGGAAPEPPELPAAPATPSGDPVVEAEPARVEVPPPSGVGVTVAPLVTSVAPGATLAFTATVAGSDDGAVRWTATGGTITQDGRFTAPAEVGGYAIRATTARDPGASAIALVNVVGGGDAGKPGKPAAATGWVVEPFYETQRPYVQIMTPMPHATYYAPATIRVWAHAPNPGKDAVHGYSPRVDFHLGDERVGSTSLKPTDLIDYYQVDITGVPAGSYEVFARSHMASGVVESVRVPVTVVEPPPARPLVELTRDLVLRGDASFELIGTAVSRARLISPNGSRIRSAPGWTGRLTIRNADIIGLGAMDIPAIEVTAVGTSAIEITGSVFDRCGPPRLTANDRAPVTIRGNTFRPNMLVPVNSEPDYAGSHPSLVFAGNSTAPKRFQGNNVGVSFVRFERSSHWLIGGDRDADGNILLGVRAGLQIESAVDITIRGNLLSHRYPFGWSQGHNLHFKGEPTRKVLVEHNVFRSSSWMVQNLTGEFRYNLLIDNINEAFFRYVDTGVRIHHNILVNTGFQRQYVPSGGVLYANGSFENNTVDVGGLKLGWLDYAFMPADAKHQLTSVRNNVFSGFAYRKPNAVIAVGAARNADHNCFHNPDTRLLTRYGDERLGANDCGGGASTDPRFAAPRAVPFPVGDGDVWRRRITVSQILALYRGMYTPSAGSPLIDAGDPADDTAGQRNTDIGAVGAGEPHPEDKFGRFGP